jgi:hypothetical protein
MTKNKKETTHIHHAKATLGHVDTDISLDFGKPLV